MSDTKLRACPFCGKNEQAVVEAALAHEDDSRDDLFFQKYVECQNCGSLGGSADTRVEAIKSWNDRPEQGKARVSREQIEVAAKRLKFLVDYTIENKLNYPKDLAIENVEDLFKEVGVEVEE